MDFGFSPIGAVYIAMLLIPNILWTKNLPEGYEESKAKENRVLVAFERTGPVLVTFFSAASADIALFPEYPRVLLLAASFLLMVLYEIFWVKYFRSERRLEDLYGSILFIPAAGAVLPVLSFLLLSIYGRSIYLLVSTVILGIGHIGIHASHIKELRHD